MIDERLQRGNFSTAVLLAEKLNILFAARPPAEPVLASDTEVIQLFREARHWNPRLEPYLLRGDGTVLVDGTETNREGKKVSLIPIRELQRFVSPQLPVYGDDPKSPESQRAFNVAPVILPTGGGFLYLLHSHPMEELLRSGKGRMILVGELVPIFFTLSILIAALFLVAVYYLTSRFRRFVYAAGKLAQGDYLTTIPVDSEDTLGELAIHFNKMRASILVQDKQLAERESRRRLLLANVAHDLRVPLSVIKGFIELLRSRTRAPHEREVAVAAITRNVRREREFLADLESLANLEFERPPEALDDIELLSIVEDLVQSLSAEASRKEIAVRIEVPERAKKSDSGFTVRGSRVWLERMLLNILNNALRYTPAGGTITVRAHSDGDYVVTEIEDTGSGIPEEDLPQIFDEFYRVQRKPTDDPGGTGLGLSIVQKIVKFHRGRVSVRSKVGVGTCFSVRLPFSGPDYEGVVETETHEAATPTSEAPLVIASFAKAADDSTYEPTLDFREMLRNWRHRGSTTPVPSEMKRLRWLFAAAYIVSAIFMFTAFSPLMASLWTVLGALVCSGYFDHDKPADERAADSGFVGVMAAHLFLCPSAVVTISIAALVALMHVRRSYLPSETHRLWRTHLSLGLLFSLTAWMLDTVYPPGVVPIIGIGFGIGIYSLAYLTRSLDIWAAYLLPFCLTWAAFLKVHLNFETPGLGMAAGIMVGVLMLSTRIEKEYRSIETRFMMMFTIAFTVAAFLEAFLTQSIWHRFKFDATRNDLFKQEALFRQEYQKALDTGDESQTRRVMEMMLRYNPLSVVMVDDGVPRDTVVSTMQACGLGNCTRWGMFDSKRQHVEEAVEVPMLYESSRDRTQVVLSTVRTADGKRLTVSVADGLRDFYIRELVQFYVGMSLLFQSAVIMMVATMLRWMLHVIMNSRLRTIQTTIDRLEQGEEGARVSDRLQDEIGEIGRAMNRMADARSARRRAIVDADSRRRELIEAILEGFRGPLHDLERCSAGLSVMLPADARGDASVGPPESELIDQIESLISTQASLVDDLLTLSRLENAREITREDPVSMGELLDELSGQLGSEQLRIDVQNELPYFEADAERLGRALGEYVEDLAKDANGVGPVHAAVSREGERVVVELARKWEQPLAQAIEREVVHSFSIKQAIADRILLLHGGTVQRGGDDKRRSTRIVLPVGEV